MATYTLIDTATGAAEVLDTIEITSPAHLAAIFDGIALARRVAEASNKIIAPTFDAALDAANDAVSAGLASSYEIAEVAGIYGTSFHVALRLAA